MLIVKCPTCGANEMHPDNTRLLIRAHKVMLSDGMWRSQCLVCAGYYDKDLNETPQNYAQEKGWFKS